MNKDVLSFVTEKTRELIDAPTVSSETKAAAQSWLEAAGTDRERKKQKNTSTSWRKTSCRSII